MDYAALCEKQGLKKLWQKELEMQNRDDSVAMKIPHYMKKAGLRDIDCRMNDKVLYLEPEKEGYLINEGWWLDDFVWVEVIHQL